MKKNIGSQLALYPTPVTAIGTMNGNKPAWTLAAHVGIIGHGRILASLAAAHFINGIINEAGKINYHTLKPVLFEFSTCEYLKTGDVIGKCLSLKNGESI